MLEDQGPPRTYLNNEHTAKGPRLLASPDIQVPVIVTGMELAIGPWVELAE